MVVIANLIPTVEQIGGITLGLTMGINPITVLLISLIVNCLIFFPVYFGLKLFYDKYLYKIKILQRYVERVRKRGKPYIDKYGIFGLMIFRAFPSPFTGTYAASIFGWFLGLDWKKSFAAVFFGSIISLILIFLGYYGIYNILKIVIGF